MLSKQLLKTPNLWSVLILQILVSARRGYARWVIRALSCQFAIRSGMWCMLSHFAIHFFDFAAEQPRQYIDLTRTL